MGLGLFDNGTRWKVAKGTRTDHQRKKGKQRRELRRKGEAVNRTQKGGRVQASLRWEEAALLASAQESFQPVADDRSELLVFERWLGGERCGKVLVDAVAPSNFVISRLVLRHKLKVQRMERSRES
jgi:hypothetical protein